MTVSSQNIPIDSLITNGTVLTMDMARREIVDGAVAIDQGIIVDIGTTSLLKSKYAAVTEVDANQGIVMPGLINGHCHAAMSLFRGYAENRPLDKFLECVWEAEGKYLNRDRVMSAAFVSCMEMARSGITTFVDMYWYPDSTVAAAQSVGLNLMTGPVFVSFPGVDNLPNWEDRLTDFRAFYEANRNKAGVHFSIAPHSCYALTEHQLIELASLAKQNDLRIQIHASEALSEMASVRETFQATPIEVLDRTGILNEGCTIAHGVHVSDADLSRLKSSKASIVHCPISNAKTAAGIARVSELRREGISVGLGTDGPSTGNDLDLWKVMRTAALMQSLKYSDPTALSNQDVIAMATIEGARALGLDKETGSLETGKQADLIVVSTTNPHMRPVYDVCSALVFCAGRDDVTDVFVRGNHILKGTKLQNTNIAVHEREFAVCTETIRHEMEE